MAPPTTIADRASRLLSLDGFANSGAPELISRLALSAPSARQYVLRMAIRADHGAFLVPDELAWLAPMLDTALAHQATLGLDHPFCYATVRHGLVDSTTDDAWHVDGFSMKVPHTPEQNYVWCSHTGTEYAPVEARFPADFDPLRHNVNDFLADLVDDASIDVCAPGTVYCMDPFLLHRRPDQTAGAERTFVRISFVPIEIDDVNNTQNPLLPRRYTHDGVAYRNGLSTYRPATRLEGAPNEMRLLPAPSRRRDDIAISLRAPAGDARAAHAVADEALGASCPPDKAERVRLAIFHAGRYDCRVSLSAVAPRNLDYLRRALGEVNVDILILDDDGVEIDQATLPLAA